MKSPLRILPKGLAGKLIAFIVAFVLIMGAFFMLVFGVHLVALHNMIQSEENKQLELVSSEFGNSMNEITENYLQKIINSAVERSNDEFRIAAEDLRTLRSQVEEVFKHPENFKPKEISPPELENGDNPVMQLLAPNGYENISPETYEMMQRLANLEPIMKGILLSEDYYIDSYISTPDGVTLSYDRLSEAKFDENGNIKRFDARERGWFKGALEEKDVFFSSTLKSSLYGFNEIVYSAPVYVDDKLVAVLEGCLHVEDMAKYSNGEDRGIGEKGFSIFISKDGQLSSSPREEGELKVADDMTLDIRDSVNPSLSSVIDKGLSGNTGVEIVEVDGEEYYAAYGYIPLSGWLQIIFVSVDEVSEATNNLLLAMDDNSKEVISKENKFFNLSVVITFAALLVMIILAIVAITKRAKKRVEPISHMTDKLRELSGFNMFFEMEDIYKTGDEIEVLARSFESMSGKMRDYVDELVDEMVEKERVKTELDLATKIQTDMLPNIFPAFPNRPEFNIYASMTPAKEVGGDFYDFFFAGENHLALVIADVSGKGVPAAMFMMMAKSMIQSQMTAKKDVKTVLEDVNNLICSNNREKMFVTVWIGILDIESGILTASNAGHEYPIFKEPDGNFEIIKDKHGFVIGGKKNMKYTDYELQMKPGSKLFVYTDGVPEAMNEENELFGMERTLSAVNINADSSADIILKTVESEVRKFVGNAEQFDDLTMLCVEYFGAEGKPDDYEEIVLEAKAESILDVQDLVGKKLDLLACKPKVRAQIDVAIDELFGNIANYAYEGGEGEAVVGVLCDFKNRSIEITFKDRGVEFNPLDKNAPDVTLAARKRKIGGLGIFVVRNTMDDMTYEYKDGQNILKIKKFV